MFALRGDMPTFKSLCMSGGALIPTDMMATFTSATLSSLISNEERSRCAINQGFEGGQLIEVERRYFHLDNDVDLGVYFHLRDAIVYEWSCSPSTQLTLSDAIKRIAPELHRPAAVVYQFLTAYGYINSGVLPELEAQVRDETPDGVTSKRVIVVGAGLSGIMAARQLGSLGHAVTVIEARDRIGGRIFTDELGIDLSSNLIDGDPSNPLVRVAQQIGCGDRIVPLRPHCPLYLLHGGHQISRRMDHSIREEWNAAIDAIHSTWTEEQLGRTLNDALVSESPLFNYYRHRLEITETAPLSAIPVERFRDSINRDPIVPSFLVGGHSQLLTRLAEGLDIRLNSAVRKIDYSEETVKIITTFGDTFLADAVVVTVPLPLLQQNTIQFAPDLPSTIELAINGTQCGTLNHLVMQFPDIFWPVDVDAFGAVSPLNNASSEGIVLSQFRSLYRIVRLPVLIADSVDPKFDKIGVSDLVASALSTLRRIFPTAIIPSPTRAFRTAWNSDPYARCSNPIRLDGGDLAFANLQGRVFFAGDGVVSSPSSFGTCTGAYQSGLIVAGNVHVALAPTDTHLHVPDPLSDTPHVPMEECPVEPRRRGYLPLEIPEPPLPSPAPPSKSPSPLRDVAAAIVSHSAQRPAPVNDSDMARPAKRPCKSTPALHDLVEPGFFKIKSMSPATKEDPVDDESGSVSDAPPDVVRYVSDDDEHEPRVVRHAHSGPRADKGDSIVHDAIVKIVRKYIHSSAPKLESAQFKSIAKRATTRIIAEWAAKGKSSTYLNSKRKAKIRNLIEKYVAQVPSRKHGRRHTSMTRHHSQTSESDNGVEYIE